MCNNRSSAVSSVGGRQEAVAGILVPEHGAAQLVNDSPVQRNLLQIEIKPAIAQTNSPKSGSISILTLL
jgi:hypothetical protein